MPAGGDIAVVIATRDRPELLRRCLTSVARQTRQPSQVLVVNDGDTPIDEVIREFVPVLTLKSIEGSKLGVATARNLANAHVSASITCVMDDDDIMLPWRLAHHLAAAETGADVSYGGWVNFDPDAGSMEFHAGKDFSLPALMLAGRVLTHGSAAFATSLLQEYRYDENLRGGADFDLIARIARGGARFIHCRSFAILRRLHRTRIGTEFGQSQSAVRSSRVRAWSRSLTRAELDLAQSQARSALPPATLSTPSIPILTRTSGIGTPAVMEIDVNRGWLSSADILKQMAVVGAGSTFVRDPRPEGAAVTVGLAIDMESHRPAERLLTIATAAGLSPRLLGGDTAPAPTWIRSAPIGSPAIRHQLKCADFDMALSCLRRLTPKLLWYLYADGLPPMSSSGSPAPFQDEVDAVAADYGAEASHVRDPGQG